MQSETVLLAQKDLMIFLIIFFIGILGGKLAERFRFPDVVIYIVIGLVIGPQALGIIDIPAQSLLNQIVLLFGASFILFHGGMVTSFRVIKQTWLSITLLSTIGVVITAFVVAVIAHYVFDLPFLMALLLGSILASTDPAALVPIFQRFPVRPKVAQAVISESAFTDATGAIMTTVVFGIVTAGSALDWGNVSGQFLWLAGVGIVSGAMIGYVSAWLISGHKWGWFRDYTPMVTVMTVLASYLITDHMLHASGFMAVFTAGLMHGNFRTFGLTIRPKEEHATHQFIDPISLKLRMLIFVLLGSQVDFSVLKEYGFLLLVVALAFIFIARPLTVLASLLPDRKARWTGREIVFFFWTRETGVIAAALIGIVASSSLPDTKLLSAITFVCILTTLLLQAGTTPFVARKLGLLDDSPIK